MKKQLRRKLAVIMAAAIALSAAGCGKSDKAAEEPVREETQAEQEQAEETKANFGGVDAGREGLADDPARSVYGGPERDEAI